MNEPALNESQIGSILVVRLSAIGDILFATPLVEALRRTYPQARISWLVQTEYQALLQQHPAIDRVIGCPLGVWRQHWRRGRWRRLVREVRAFGDMLQEAGFDVALDLQGLLKSGALTRLSGARSRIGLGSREGSALLMTRVIRPPRQSPRIGSEYLFLARALGLDTADFPMGLHFSQADSAAAAAMIDAYGLGAGFMAACPFTTRPQKHWFAERWAVLAERLYAEFELPMVLLGGPGDRAAGEAIAAAIATPMVNLAGQTSLLQAAALIDRSRLVIGVDTGLSHMGIALRRPTLLLFGATCPYTDTTREDARVLYHRRPCSPCRRRPTCDGRFDCMRDIDVAEVVAAARALPGVQT